MSNEPLLESIERRLTAGLVPVRPIATRPMMVALGVALVLCVAVGAWRMGVLAPAVMTAGQLGVVVVGLAVAGGLLVRSAVLQVVPGARHRMAPPALAVAVPVALGALMAAAFVAAPQPALLHRAWNCFRSGLPVAGMAALATYAVLRRGVVLWPRTAAATAGMLAGLAGTAALSLHCPNLNAWHILVGHLGVAAAGSVAGLACGAAVELLRGRRIDTFRTR